MDKQLEVLSISEQKTIAEALLTMVSGYGFFPTAVTLKKIYWQSLDTTECIGIYTMAGALYLKKHIDGSFLAQFPFCIRYVCKPSNNSARVKKQDVLDSLGEWLETTELPLMTGDREIEAIGRTGTTYLAGADASGNDIYQCNFNLKYRKVVEREE